MKATSRLLRVLIESEFLSVPVGSAYYRATPGPAQHQASRYWTGPRRRRHCPLRLA